MRLGELFMSVREAWHRQGGFPVAVEDDAAAEGGAPLLGCYFRRLLDVLPGGGGRRDPVLDAFFAFQNFAAHGLAPPMSPAFLKCGWVDFEDFCAPLIDVEGRSILVRADAAGGHEALLAQLEQHAGERFPVTRPQFVAAMDALAPRSVGAVAVAATGTRPELPPPSSLAPWCDVLVAGEAGAIRACWEALAGTGLALRSAQLLLRRARGLDVGHAVLAPPSA